MFNMGNKSVPEDIYQYCVKECPHGKRKSEELLQNSESVVDAVFDMYDWVSDCYNSKNRCTKYAVSIGR